MLKSQKYPQSLPQANAVQFNDVEEGGLKLGQVGAALRRRALLIVGVTGVVASGAVLKAKQDPPVYEGKFEILTKPVTGENKAVANVPQTLASVETVVPESAKEIETTIQVLQSPRVLEPVIAQLQTQYPDLTYDLVVNSLVITSTKQNLLEVQYVDPDKKLVTDVLTKVKEAYLNYSLAERQADVNQAINFVKKQREPLEERVKSWQNQLRKLRLDNQLIEPAQKAQQVSSYITSLTQQQLENRVQFEQMIAKYQDLQRELAQEPGERAGNSVLTDNVRYQKILDQIQELDIEIKKDSVIFTDEGLSKRGRLPEKKASLLALLSQEEERVQRDFQSRIRELEARDKSLDDKIKYLNNYVKQLATISRNYDNIQRELQIATEGLNQFTAKQQALQIEKAQTKQPWLLLDPQLTKVSQPNPVSESAKKNLALGTMLGLLLGVGAALVVDKLSNIFYSSKELKEATGLPLLGVVPFRKELAAATKNNATGTQQPGRTFFFEVFRSLYTNILLLGSDTPIGSIVISSAQ